MFTAELAAPIILILEGIINAGSPKNNLYFTEVPKLEILSKHGKEIPFVLEDPSFKSKRLVYDAPVSS